MSDEPDPKYLYEQHPFNQHAALYEPLGAFVVHFADVEERVMHALVTLMRLSPENGFAVEALTQNFQTRIELLDIMSQNYLKSKEDKKLAKAVANHLRTVNSDRNNLIHDAWADVHPAQSPNEFNKFRSRATSGQLKRIDLTAITPDLIWKEVEHVIRVGLLVTFLPISLHDAESVSQPSLPPWLDTLPKRSPLAQLLRDSKAKDSRKRP